MAGSRRGLVGGGGSIPALTDNGTTVTSTERLVGPTSSTVPQLSDTATNGSGWAISGPNIWGISAAARVLGLSGTTTFVFGSGLSLSWSSNADPGLAGGDTFITRDGAVGTLALKQSATTDALFRVYGANAGFWEHYSATELLTLSTGGTTTNTAANLLPANSIIHAVCCRITTAIATATNWSVGDSTTAARFSASNATLTLGTTSVGLDHMSGAVTTLAAGPSQAAAATVRITTTGTPSAGAIRITVYASRFVAPTS